MEKKQEEKNTEKVKKRTSLKNIIGGDILATDFFRRQAGLLFLIMVLIIIYINNRYECQLQLIEIDNLKKRADRHQVRCPDTQFGIDGAEPPIAHRGIHRHQRKRFADFH